MSKVDVIRAWKDEEYRLSLSEAQRAALPQNPAGLVDLMESDMAQVFGGIFGSWFLCTVVTCQTCFTCKSCFTCNTCWLFC
jgi:mersacidin/lichenicidin family type 2 lantibiotic